MAAEVSNAITENSGYKAPGQHKNHLDSMLKNKELWEFCGEPSG